ncbi:MAG: Gfo/Idh/MocA family oxidoreductase [Acetobacteraceae bacterium]|nr:Gfo/Idh/MocA family oxidoreductase [Acetobacteraceae bacterium]
MERPVTAAILGLGWWGRTIVDTLRGSPALRIVAGFDPAPEAAGFAAEAVFTMKASYDEILRDSAIEAVILCTPHTQHAEQIARAAEAGKHVFCEKPLCLTRGEAETAIAACQRAGVQLGVGHERRFEPPILELRRLVESGDLGTALQIEANFSQDKFLALPADNWRLSGAEAPAGPMTATGIHLLDLAVSFLGPAESVLANVRQLGSKLVNGDTLAALVAFRGGANALLTAILATPFDGRFAIYGSQGWAEVRDKAHPERSEGWTLTTAMRGRERTVREFAPAPAVRANLEAFAAAVAGGAAYPVPPEQMLATIAAFEAVVRSSRSRAIERVEG